MQPRRWWGLKWRHGDETRWRWLPVGGDDGTCKRPRRFPSPGEARREARSMLARDAGLQIRLVSFVLTDTAPPLVPPNLEAAEPPAWP